MLALDCGQDFDPAREEEFLGALPARPAVFLVEPRAAEAHPYLARTADLRRRMVRLLGAPRSLPGRVPEVPSRQLHLREFAARVRYRLTGSTFEQNLVLYQHARELFPRRYRDLLRLRPPVLLKVNLANEYPRCYVTRRIRADDSTGRIAEDSFYFGPFPTRKAAETFSNEFLNLFKIRRCQIKIRRDPGFPGCIYSEMKMCLAPCFAGCSKEEYDIEVGRVVGFLASSGAAQVSAIEREREAASGSLDFERAAALHRKLEKVAEVLRGLPELARKVDELDAAILQRAAEENTIAIFVVRGGRITDPFFLRFGELASQPRSLEEILRQQLDPQMNGNVSGGVLPLEERALGSPPPHWASEALAEDLALLARWVYSKPRQGEIFFRQPDWPYRRIIRACSRLLASQNSLPSAPIQGRAPGL